MDLALQLAPNFAGFTIGIYLIWKIASNALHGISESNLRIATTQAEIVTTLKTISGEIVNHSASDSKIFERIQDNLQKQTEILVRIEDRTGRNGQKRSR